MMNILSRRSTTLMLAGLSGTVACAAKAQFSPANAAPLSDSAQIINAVNSMVRDGSWKVSQLKMTWTWEDGTRPL